MKRTSTFIIALVVAGLIALQVHAAGTNTWATGYPKTGTATGTILVKGTATPDTGFTLSNTGQVAFWPVGGGKVLFFNNLSVNADGTWGETSVTGATSGVTYNVVVQINETSGQTGHTLATDPKTAKAK
jgi:hypothetical protein